MHVWCYYIFCLSIVELLQKKLGKNNFTIFSKKAFYAIIILFKTLNMSKDSTLGIGNCLNINVMNILKIKI